MKFLTFKNKGLIVFAIALFLSGNCSARDNVEGWVILSNDIKSADTLLESARDYDIDHIELSHEFIKELRDLRKDYKRKAVVEFLDKAKKARISDVFLWDYCLYDKEYYPDKYFLENGKLNLDNPEFWKRFQQDYNQLLSLADFDGVVLNFIGMGLRVEDQFSSRFKSKEAKLSYLVDKVADVVFGNDMELYIRGWAYSDEEFESLIRICKLIRHDDVKLVFKDNYHDFFITQPSCERLKKIDRDIIIEFDAANEFLGQGVVANTFGGVFADKLRYYLQFDNVQGYIARTDRFDNTSIIDTPAEINLFALNEIMDDKNTDNDEVFKDFIYEHYWYGAVNDLEPVFKSARDFVLSTFYTLGINNDTGSRLAYGDVSSFSIHIEKRRKDNSCYLVENGINKKFCYPDILKYLASDEFKKKVCTDKRIAERFNNIDWANSDTKMTPEIYKAIIRENEYGVKIAKKNFEIVKEVYEDYHFDNSLRFNDEELRRWTMRRENLHTTFSRSVLIAELRKDAAIIYFGSGLLEDQPDTKVVSDEEIRTAYDRAMATGKLLKSTRRIKRMGNWRWDEEYKIVKEYFKDAEKHINNLK